MYREANIFCLEKMPLTGVGEVVGWGLNVQTSKYEVIKIVCHVKQQITQPGVSIPLQNLQRMYGHTAALQSKTTGKI